MLPILNLLKSYRSVVLQVIYKEAQALDRWHWEALCDNHFWGATEGTRRSDYRYYNRP